jgi:hypothetical protein
MLEVTKKLRDPAHTSCPAVWNAHARSNVPYALSSCAIALLGATLLLAGWLGPGVLLCFQAVASFFADVWYCGVRSLWHGIDKWCSVASAVVLLFVFGSFVSACCADSALHLVRFVAAAVAPLAAAAMSYRRSAAAQRAGDMERYFLFHALWHYAIAASSVAVMLRC